jgi:succinoglycan biosynthesis transport protein ExoP
MTAMDEREIHLRYYLRVIKKRRFIVITLFTIVFTAFLIVTLSSTPVYKASAKVLIERGESAPLRENYYYPSYDPEFYETQYQLIKSTSVARKVVTMLSLDTKYETFFKEDQEGFSPIRDTINWFRELFHVVSTLIGAAKPDTEITNKEETGGPEPVSRVDMLARMISGEIIVNPVKNSRIVNVGYMSPNPYFASMIANTVAKAYIEEMLEMKMSSSRYTIEWMTKKAEEERGRLEKSEQALQDYMRANDIVTLENRVAIVPQKLSEFSSQQVRDEAKRKELEALYNKIKVMSGNPDKAETIPAIASDPMLQSLREQILKAEQNVTEFSKKFGKKHPTMIKAVGELDMLKKKREQEILRIIESIRNEYELAKSNEADTRRLLANTKGEALNLNEKFIQYEILKREVENNRQLYDTLIKQIKEQSITEQAHTVNVWIIEHAEIPKSPAKPQKSLNIFLGIIFGLFGGIGLAFFVEYLDNTVKSPDDVERRLQTPVLGTVPTSKVTDIAKIILKRPSSIFSEKYKAIRTAVLLSSADTPPKSILITSMGPEEGKTVSSINLALTIAQSEYSVLLIDSDLRKPKVHRIFGLKNSKGLSTYLSDTSDINIVQEGPLPNLGIIPSGPIPQNPSELLSSNRMIELIRLLNERYNIIICDSPPLLAFADSLILSKILEGTIIITKAGETTYEVVRVGLKSLEDMKSHILGIIINGLDAKPGDPYYYRYYSYYQPKKYSKR